MSSIIGVLYFCLGIVQFLAMLAGMTDYVGLHWLIAVPLAILLAYTPLIGSILGVLGAVYGWDWEWWQAIVLFFGPLLFVAILAAASGLLDAITARSRTRS